MNNLYLTGIMGCGKSTVGKKAARILKTLFFDVDHEIEKREGMSVRKIFEQEGEESFRRIESLVLLDLASQKGALVSTGGGIILLEKNVDRMKKTGKIVWVRRPVKTILAGVNTRVRPLIKDNPGKLLEIYAAREPLYQKYADFIVDNDGSLDDAAEAVVEIYLQQSKE